MPRIPPLIQLEKISFAYPGTGNLLLNQIDVSMDHKQRIGLIGPNGSGKTHLQHFIGFIKDRIAY
ncbi:MAG: ATP-binding cassette domain-containing protein, partial [Candidatus Electrothrix sp. AR4]|nr:ATP-binding cassette domain-containing protein [Candidatus Electrothrix sp. AR4]